VGGFGELKCGKYHRKGWDTRWNDDEVHWRKRGIRLAQERVSTGGTKEKTRLPRIGVVLGLQEVNKDCDVVPECILVEFAAGGGLKRQEMQNEMRCDIIRRKHQPICSNRKIRSLFFSFILSDAKDGQGSQ